MTYPQRNISAEAGQRALRDAQASAYHRGRRRPVGVIGAIGRLIGFLIMLAFLAGIGLFILTVASQHGLG
jgi:hypothetical protein